MGIRRAKETDYDKLVEVWYQASIKAHYFVKLDFWTSMKEEMKIKYLPMSTTYVIEEKNTIIGFISMVDNYLAALFIDIKYQGKGYGKELLNFIKTQHNDLHLKVYQQNINTVLFYLKNGFVILRQLIDEDTDEKEYLMIWRNIYRDINKTRE